MPLVQDSNQVEVSRGTLAVMGKNEMLEMQLRMEKKVMLAVRGKKEMLEMLAVMAKREIKVMFKKA